MVVGGGPISDFPKGDRVTYAKSLGRSLNRVDRAHVVTRKMWSTSVRFRLRIAIKDRASVTEHAELAGRGGYVHSVVSAQGRAASMFGRVSPTVARSTPPRGHPMDRSPARSGIIPITRRSIISTDLNQRAISMNRDGILFE